MFSIHHLSIMHVLNRSCDHNFSYLCNAKNKGTITFFLLACAKIILILFVTTSISIAKAKQSSQVVQHLQTAKHSSNFQRRNKGNKTQSLLTLSPLPVENQNGNEFSMDLTRAFSELNIALYKIAKFWMFIDSSY